MNLDYFSELLNNTVTPAYLDNKGFSEIMEPLKKFISDNMPQKLYKYRSCCDNHLNAFYRDEVWVASAQSMNDGFDARLFFERAETIELINAQMTEDKIKEFISLLRKDTNLQEEIAKIPGGRDALINLYIPDKLLIDSIANIRDRIALDIAYSLNDLPSLTQQTMKFCCLSENISSASMWGQYAENETGFCLEYDFSDDDLMYYSPDGKTRSCTLYPVIYNKERYRVPSNYIEYLIQYRLFASIAVNALSAIGASELNGKHIPVQCPDLFMITKIALHKSIEWEYEKEWRLFCSSLNDKSFQKATHGCFKKTPTALYLGRRISEIYEKLLINLAEEKGIQVYKMKLNDTSPTYDLEYEAYSSQ